MGFSVKVRLDTLFAEIAGKKEIVATLEPDAAVCKPATVMAAIDEVAHLAPPLQKLLTDPVQRRHLKFAVNGRPVAEKEPVIPGDVIDIFSPFLGG